MFSDYYDIMVSKSVELGDIDPNLKTETIRQKIRDNYLQDSTVTVVLVGAHTWQRKFVDWEIRLIRTLKEEEVHLNDYEDITEARQRIGQFIRQVYHQKRPHSALGYLTPMEFQRKTLS